MRKDILEILCQILILFIIIAIDTRVDTSGQSKLQEEQK